MTLLPAPSLVSDAPAATGDRTFTARVRERFSRRAATYDSQARLQRAVAWRLAGLARTLPLPAGPLADLGAGSGLLSLALVERRPELAQRPPLQLDLCPDLLARNPLVQQAHGRALPPWDLNQPLPPQLSAAALLASSFALQWLDQPASALAHWCERLAPGGWLLLALPVAGSFRAWRQAATAASLPYTGLPLPEADTLASVAAERLGLCHNQRLRFSQAGMDGLATLRLLGGLGATASRQAPLGPGQLRRLLRHWPSGAPLDWEVLVLIGQRLP